MTRRRFFQALSAFGAAVCLPFKWAAAEDPDRQWYEVTITYTSVSGKLYCDHMDVRQKHGTHPLGTIVYLPHGASVEVRNAPGAMVNSDTWLAATK